jgi:hypothetical protein
LEVLTLKEAESLGRRSPTTEQSAEIARLAAEAETLLERLGPDPGVETLAEARATMRRLVSVQPTAS